MRCYKESAYVFNAQMAAKTYRRQAQPKATVDNSVQIKGMTVAGIKPSTKGSSKILKSVDHCCGPVASADGIRGDRGLADTYSRI
jgi:hypothetical protein